jgi:hypothetical protein
MGRGRVRFKPLGFRIQSKPPVWLLRMGLRKADECVGWIELDDAFARALLPPFWLCVSQQTMDRDRSNIIRSSNGRPLRIAFVTCSRCSAVWVCVVLGRFVCWTHV